MSAHFYLVRFCTIFVLPMIDESVFDGFPQLQSERLLLRSFQISDAADIQFIRSHPEIVKYLDSDPHNSLETSQAFVQNNLDAFQNKTGIAWVICEKHSMQCIGDFSYWRLDKKNHRGEIGYTLKPDFWGKGLMHETMQILIPFGFNQLKLHSIEANINPQNENSRKLLVKMGFQKEAYFRENYFYNGNYLDSEIYSLLQQWWKPGR